MKNEPYISKGNKKMSIPTFSLPCRITCPGSTKYCRDNCYAKKAERMYNPVLPCRMRNLEYSKESDFAEKVMRTLRKLRKLPKYFRIHESGDFYSQEYLEKWFAVCEMFPDIKFLAFTKSHHLDFAKKPDNLTLVYSIMPDTKHFLAGFPVSFAGECGKKATFECVGQCDECLICWNLKPGESVHFDIH